MPLRSDSLPRCQRSRRRHENGMGSVSLSVKVERSKYDSYMMMRSGATLYVQQERRMRIRHNLTEKNPNLHPLYRRILVKALMVCIHCRNIAKRVDFIQSLQGCKIGYCLSVKSFLKAERGVEALSVKYTRVSNTSKFPGNHEVYASANINRSITGCFNVTFVLKESKQM